MARTSSHDWVKVQALMEANMTEKGLTSEAVYRLVTEEEQLSKEGYSSFQVALSNAIRAGHVTGFESKKGAGGGYFRAGEVPKSEGKSSLPSFPTKTLSIGGVEVKIKASGLSVKHNGQSFSKLSHAEGFRKVAELLVTAGSEDARTAQDLVALIEDNVSQVERALAALSAPAGE